MDEMSGSYIIITTTSGHLKQVSDGDIQAFIKAQLPMIPEREIILVRENSAERIRAKVTCELDSGMYTSTYCVWTLCFMYKVYKYNMWCNFNSDSLFNSLSTM